MTNLVFLYIQSWIGLSPEACHYQGELQGDKHTIQLKRILSKSTAAKLNAIRRRQYPGAPEYAIFRAGMEYNGFDSRDELISLALKSYKTHFPDATILILGRNSIGDPQFILDHPDKRIMEKANRIYEEFESFEGYQFRRNWGRADKLQTEWNDLLKK